MLDSVSHKDSSPEAERRTGRPLPRYPGVDCSVRCAESGSEISLTVRCLPGEGVMEIFSRLGLALKELDATIVHLMVFGSVKASAAGEAAMRRVFGTCDWPVTWV